MTLTPTSNTVDEFRPERAHRATWALAPFTDATVLDAADVHVAQTLLRLVRGRDDARAGDESGDPADPGRETDLVALAIALAVRAIRHGSVTVDLATVATTVTVDEGVDVEIETLPWPEPDLWVRAVAESPLVAVGDASTDGGAEPLRLLGTRLALDRYWRHERAIAADLTARVTADVGVVDLDLLRAGLDRLFDDPAPDHQRLAAATAVLRSFSVVAGGPGTGKTTTVASILALLHEQARAHEPPLRIALAAPTGKAAARLTEAIHDRAAALDVDADVRDAILATEASTIHRLLGRAPGSNSRFRHDRSNQLPHQVVIIDETSMVSLSLMARLIEAVRPTARLILVGDPQQLASVEAGAVLGDIVGPAAEEFRLSPAARRELTDATGHPIPDGPAGSDGSSTNSVSEVDGDARTVGDGIVVLRTVHRYTGGIGELATAIESGEADRVIEVLQGEPEGIGWLDVDVADASGLEAMEAVRSTIVGPASLVVAAARQGDAPAALAAMRRVQVLCAHRRGPHGVSAWRAHIESWLTASIAGYAARGWFAGRPLLMTENDYALDLFNGDTGVAVAAGVDRLACAFERRGELLMVSPSRLRAVETLYAMTIHKSQGSQFGEVVVILPDEGSPILTRELLYTAVTRAEAGVRIVGTEAAVRAAVSRPVSRASGLRARLWD